MLDKNLIGDRDKTLYQTRLDYLSNFFASYAEPEDPAHTEAPMAQQVHDRLEKAQEILGYGQTVLAIPQDLAEALSLWTEYQNTMSDFEQANSSLDPDKSLAILVRSFVEGDLDLEYFLQKLASLNQEASLLHQRTLWNNETNQTGLVYKIQALEKQALTKLREDDALFIVNRLRTALYHLELTYQHEMARDTAVRKDFVQTAGSVLTYWQKSLITGWPSNTKQDNDGLNYEIDNSKKNKIIYFTPEAFIESIQGS
ncbi:hypothetical protein KJ708_03395, partial [bacterium]|nr:hypothetical protein [bacterium]MBU1918157.1 hypothetical protein [bacterium]